MFLYKLVKVLYLILIRVETPTLVLILDSTYIFKILLYCKVYYMVTHFSDIP